METDFKQKTVRLPQPLWERLMRVKIKTSESFAEIIERWGRKSGEWDER